MRTTEQCLVAVDPEAVAERLADAIAEGAVEGSVRPGGFTLTAPLHSGRNSWRAVMTGTLVAVEGGTLVEVSMMPHPFVVLFTLVHAIPFLGLSWLLGVAAFSSDVGRSLGVLGQALGAYAVGREEVERVQPLSDPTRPGAEVGAPLTLSPRVEQDGAVFVVDRWTLRVGAAGARTVGPDGVERELPWEELVGADATGGALVLRLPHGAEVALPLRSVPEAHGLWLAAYVDAVAHRFRASADQVARQDAARRQLGALRERQG